MRIVKRLLKTIAWGFFVIVLWIFLPPVSILQMWLKPGLSYTDVKLVSVHGYFSDFRLRACSRGQNWQLVFRSQEDLNQWIDSFRNCALLKNEPPDSVFFFKTKSNRVDFSKQIVLVNMLSGSCGSRIYKRVYVDVGNKKITYKVDKSESFCMSGPPNGGMNYIAIKKPDPDYKIVFERQNFASHGKAELLKE